MTKSIGQIIKELRKERNLTQEELAEQLNVTAKAVSKWENESGLPDISQVVPLANVFGVPTDVLFGTADVNRDEEVERILGEASAIMRKNYDTEEEEFAASVKEYELLTGALADYPNNIQLLAAALAAGGNLAGDYANHGDKERAAEIRKECIRQGNVILNYTNDVSVIMRTHWWLILIYCAMGEYGRAEEHADRLPRGFQFEQGLMKARIKRSQRDIDGELKQRCDNAAAFLGVMEYDIIRPIGDLWFDKGQYEDALRVYRMIYDLLPVIYGEEAYTPPFHTGMIGDRLALCCIKLGRYDEAVEWIWKEYHHLKVNAENYNRTEGLETPLLRECKFRFFGEAMLVKNHMDYVYSEPYCVLQENVKFKELLEALEA